jgi:hypothetical protein
MNWEKSIPKDPSVRTFDGLKRQEDGTFKDEDLARILKEAMDDPAGAFGARRVPKALKIVEVHGILQASRLPYTLSSSQLGAGSQHTVSWLLHLPYRSQPPRTFWLFYRTDKFHRLANGGALH